MFYLTFSYYTICWKHLKYQWDKNNFKKEKTHRPNTSSSWGILHKIHCQITSFCYSVIQLGSISMILSHSKGRHYISSLYERERKGEKCTTTWKRRETRNAKVKYYLNSSAMWVVTNGILFPYILLKITNSNLSFQELADCSFFPHKIWEANWGQTSCTKSAEKPNIQAVCFVSWADVWIHGKTEVLAPSQLSTCCVRF